MCFKLNGGNIDLLLKIDDDFKTALLIPRFIVE